MFKYPARADVQVGDEQCVLLEQSLCVKAAGNGTELLYIQRNWRNCICYHADKFRLNMKYLFLSVCIKQELKMWPVICSCTLNYF